MTDTPITPPLELVQQWVKKAHEEDDYATFQNVATQAARWGADQELEASCNAIYEHESQPLSGGTAEWLRAARRPKPPSLKEQALETLRLIQIDPENGIGPSGLDTIRTALEALPDD